MMAEAVRRLPTIINFHNTASFRGRVSPRGKWQPPVEQHNKSQIESCFFLSMGQGGNAAVPLQNYVYSVGNNVKRIFEM